MNSRSSNVDLARFISALIIMELHFYYSDIFHKSGWIYVEFFLIITGYYTAKHFDGKIYNNPIKESIIYTFKKFIPLLPYTIVTTVLTYLLFLARTIVLNEGNVGNYILNSLNNFFYDILLLIGSYDDPISEQLWYLSAMILIFPIFSWIMETGNRYWIMIITFLYPLFYYGIVGINGNRILPHNILRVFAGLCIGAFIYEFVYVFGDYLNGINKMLLNILAR